MFCYVLAELNPACSCNKLSQIQITSLNEINFTVNVEAVKVYRKHLQKCHLQTLLFPAYKPSAARHQELYDSKTQCSMIII